MNIYISSDHAGFELKKVLFDYVRKDLGFNIEDLGAFQLNSNDDYPDFINLTAEKVSADPENTKGIVIGGSGQGEAIAANRFPHVRAALYYGGTTDIIRLSREHNDANILSLGARFLSEDEAKSAVKLWFETAFSNEERHVKRIQKLN